jgi:hypothetical protein
MDAGRRLQGWKALSVRFRENEMVLVFERRGKAVMRLILKGLIACEDGGLVGRAVAGYTVTDKGSFKTIDFIPPKGGTLFHAEFMEIEIA